MLVVYTDINTVSSKQIQYNPKTPDHNYANPSLGLYIQIISTKAALPQRAAGHYPKHYPVL